VGALGVLPRAMVFEGGRSSWPLFHSWSIRSFRGTRRSAITREGLRRPAGPVVDGRRSRSVKAGWTALGGHAADLMRSTGFRILRPFGTARIGLSRIGRAGRMLKPASGVLTVPFDLLLSKMPLPPCGLRFPFTVRNRSPRGNAGLHRGNWVGANRCGPPIPVRRLSG